MKIDIRLITPNPENPRTVFDPEKLEELAQSIRENGLIQPVVVEEAGDQYILVDGERRWRACQSIGWEQIDAFVNPPSNHNGVSRLIKALVANIQRAALCPLDEARAYKKLVEELGTLDEVSKRVGVSTAKISVYTSILKFPESLQKLYNLRKIPIDPISVAAMKRLSPEQQIRIAGKATTRHVSGKVLARLIESELSASELQHGILPKEEKKAVKIQGHFDALAMIDEKRLPEGVKDAVKGTCQACSLYEEASEIICRECPLPDFLKRLERQLQP